MSRTHFKSRVLLTRRVKFDDECVSWQGNIKKKGSSWRISVLSLIMFLPVSQALSESRTVTVVETSGLLSSTCVSLDEM